MKYTIAVILIIIVFQIAFWHGIKEAVGVTCSTEIPVHGEQAVRSVDSMVGK